MYVPIAEAHEQLDELVDLVEAGEEVILTRDGQPVVQLTPVSRPAGHEANVKGS